MVSLGREIKGKEVKTMRYVMSHAGFEVGAPGWDSVNNKTIRGFKKME